MPLCIEKLRRDHRVDGFDCGKEPLNRFLIRFALQSQLSNGSQTYLALADDVVVGFYPWCSAMSPMTMRPSGCAKGWPGLRSR